jgi:flavin reductase (DIM6/NTAB) family NADH-FMN oxidoreductase RutF
MASSDANLAAEIAILERALDRELWLITASDGTNLGGLIATHVSMASIVPSLPRVIVGIARQHRTCELIEASGAFGLHLVGEEHLDWTLRFGLQSSRVANKFDGLQHRPGLSGAPLLAGALGWLDCRVEARFETGDRTIYLAEIVAAQAPQSPRVLTTRRWLELLPNDVRDRASEQRRSDAAVDAAAIVAWRRERAGG